MDKKALEAFAREAAKSIKTESDLDDFRKMLTKVTVETALNVELDEHLGYEKHSPKPSSNSRNGYTSKSIITDDGEVPIDVPRDRESSFEPKLVRKHQTRPLDEVYPIVYLDCIVVKIRQDKQVINKAVYLALGVNMEGQKELLGMWLSETEGAKFWLAVLTELQNRGVKDILIACVDGLKGFPDAINAAFPNTQIQLCIVHMVRNSVRYVPWKDYKSVTADLKKIYQSKTEDEALLALEQFSDKWDDKYPQISRSWTAHWANLNTLFNYPEDIRRAIYTTNAIESLNSVIRKAIKKRKLFPTDESARKVIFLAIQDASKRWTMPIRNWRQALNRFMIMFEDRLTEYM
ncbi:transposase [Vibrionales bacterium SWAT-3]|nr:transposase [Vibrionales bacterium SWAT-3]